MAEGQGYSGYCPVCKKEIRTNIQGNESWPMHRCEGMPNEYVFNMGPFIKDFLVAFGTVFEENDKKHYTIPFTFTEQREAQGVSCTVKFVDDVPVSELHRMKMSRLFTINDMIDYASVSVLYAANTEGCQQPSAYLKEKYNIDV